MSANLLDVRHYLPIAPYKNSSRSLPYPSPHNVLKCTPVKPLTPYHNLRLMDNLGTSAEELEPQDVREPDSVLPRPALPPFNGYGSLQDSLQNCLSLVPKPPRSVGQPFFVNHVRIYTPCDLGLKRSAMLANNNYLAMTCFCSRIRPV
jgi:hypothetical protein